MRVGIRRGLVLTMGVLLSAASFGVGQSVGRYQREKWTILTGTVVKATTDELCLRTDDADVVCAQPRLGRASPLPQ
ncbi:MAG: hypothetical protein LC808_00665 [Actinobacteria bacterium]|nr:hypothetical protein [Actinomycetota bacterium]